MTTSDPGTDLELIAALMDGRLRGDERARAIELLANSNQALEVFADALRSQSGAHAVPPHSAGVAASVIPIGRAWKRPRWRIVTPLAAAASLAIAVMPSLRSSSGAIELAANDLALELVDSPQLARSLGAGWEKRDLGVTRGGESSPDVRRLEAEQPGLAFRLGVRSVDLQLALMRGDSGVAERVNAEIVRMLRSIGFADVVAMHYADLGAQMATEGRSQSTSRASRAERELGDLVNDRSFSLGKWMAAAELAARTHNGAFFRSRSTTQYLRAATADGALSAEDAQALEQIRSRAAAGLSDQALDELRDALRTIIRRRGG